MNCNTNNDELLMTRWQEICQQLKPHKPFSEHLKCFKNNYQDWRVEKNGPAPAWIPSKQDIQGSNIHKAMQAKGFSTYKDFHKWSVTQRSEFWQFAIEQIGFHFDTPYSSVANFDDGVENPNWLVGARYNIIDSCFKKVSAEKTAIVYQTANNQPIEKVSYAQLDQLSNQVACNLINAGFQPGDAIAIDMLMTVEAVAIYLGIVKAGCAVIGIADSFAPDEIAARLRIGKAKAVFTQDFIFRAGKQLSMYQKLIDASAPKCIVLPAQIKNELAIPLRDGDIAWQDFLVEESTFTTHIAGADHITNILFSSGTTGDPKAIPWTQTTPIKCAMDAYFHHDIHEDDVLAWPTSLGWMMGPWLIYAALLNKATIALYYEAPTIKDFTKFVELAKVTMLGVVPSLVKAWRASDAFKGADLSSIKVFSSTGECSNQEDMLYLMSQANYRPVIEYCGGTEIGGGYITGTVVQPAAPATFSTAALGLDLEILDDEDKPADEGELFILPPSIGLSNTLLNRDHHKVYYDGTPKGENGQVRRRHGDQMQRLANGYFRAHGRADDTMNLGGIKVSSADIERTLNKIECIAETAAIAVSPSDGGPSQLIVYYVTDPNAEQLSANDLLGVMRQTIKEKLNPLFRLEDIIGIEKLPRTASNKVMRRVLRANYPKSRLPAL